MTTEYVLIDHENVQPKNLHLLEGKDFEVRVFVGENQSKLSFELASSMQKLGSKARYVKIKGNGPNALDFHIAYYLGEWSREDTKSRFHVISRDTGFDPLLKHMKGRGIKAFRFTDISEIPSLRISSGKEMPDKLDVIRDNLKARGQAKPRKVSTLSSTINSLFTENLSDAALTELIGALEQSGFLAVKDGRISYTQAKG